MNEFYPYVDLGSLIAALRRADPNKRVAFGFGEPMSYRGYYEELAFKPVRDTTIGKMLAHAESALGKTFDGYKGGEYKMHRYTDCYITNYGDSGGDRIGPTLLAYWLGDYPAEGDLSFLEDEKRP